MILRVRDWKRARGWYEAALGLRAVHISDSEGLVIFDLNSATTLTIWQMRTGEVPAPPNMVGAFPIFYPERGVAETRELLRSQGVEVGPVLGDPPGLQYFTFWDLDGNRLEVCRY